MPLSRNRLYSLITLTCFAGYAWLYIDQSGFTIGKNDDVNLCAVRNIAGIPCPSCGSTRSVISIFQGHFLQALYFNPLGFVLAFVLIAAPLWIAYDFLKNKNSLFNFYYSTETFLKQKKVAIPALAILLLNWIWNIYKGI